MAGRAGARTVDPSNGLCSKLTAASPDGVQINEMLLSYHLRPSSVGVDGVSSACGLTVSQAASRPGSHLGSQLAPPCRKVS